MNDNPDAAPDPDSQQLEQQLPDVAPPPSPPTDPAKIIKPMPILKSSPIVPLEADVSVVVADVSVVVAGSLPPGQPPAVDRQSNHLAASHALVVGLIFCIVSACVYFISLKPLNQKLERMNELGPLSCDLVYVSCEPFKTQGTSCDRGEQIYNFFLNWHVKWRNDDLNGTSYSIQRPSPMVFQGCVSAVPPTVCTPELTQLISAWRNHHTCFLDREDDELIALDLNDLRASTSRSGARFISVIAFLVAGALFLLYFAWLLLPA